MNHVLSTLKWVGFVLLLFAGSLAGVVLLGDPFGLENEIELLAGIGLAIALIGLVLAIKTRWLVQISIFALASCVGSMLSYPENYHGLMLPLNHLMLEWADRAGLEGTLFTVLLLYCAVWLLAMLVGGVLVYWRARLIRAGLADQTRWILPAGVLVMLAVGLFAVFYEEDEVSRQARQDARIGVQLDRYADEAGGGRAEQEVAASASPSDAASAPTSDLENARKAMATGEYAAAKALYQPLADTGNAEAQYGLANIYLVGLGVAANEKLAMSWLEKAAEQDHPAAMYTLGKLIARDPAKAENAEVRYWLGKAESAGYPPPRR